MNDQKLRKGNLEIDKKIVTSADKCEFNFECLQNQQCECMQSKIKYHVQRKIIFVDCDSKTCEYLVPFGNSKLCDCPVRLEIYNKYEI